MTNKDPLAIAQLLEHLLQNEGQISVRFNPHCSNGGRLAYRLCEEDWEGEVCVPTERLEQISEDYLESYLYDHLVTPLHNRNLYYLHKFTLRPHEQLWQIIRSPSQFKAVFQQRYMRVEVPLLSYRLELSEHPDPHRRFAVIEFTTGTERLSPTPRNGLRAASDFWMIELYGRVRAWSRPTVDVSTMVGMIESVLTGVLRVEIQLTVVEAREATRESETRITNLRVAPAPISSRRRLVDTGYLRSSWPANSRTHPLRIACSAPEPATLSSTIPKLCQGCRNLHGQSYGGNLLVCAMYPYGNGDECPDFEG